MELPQIQLVFPASVDGKPVTADDSVNNKLCHSIYQQDVATLLRPSRRENDTPFIITGIEPNAFPAVDLGLLPTINNKGEVVPAPIRIYGELPLWPNSRVVNTLVKMYREREDWHSEMTLSRQVRRTPQLQPPHAFWSSQYVDDANQVAYYSKLNNCAQQNLWNLCQRAKELPLEKRQELYEAIENQLPKVLQDLINQYIKLPSVDIRKIWTPHDTPFAQSPIKLSLVVWDFVHGEIETPQFNFTEYYSDVFNGITQDARAILGIPGST